MNFLEQLVAEWHELQGYFVRRNVRVGQLAGGGFGGELDVVALHPGKKRLLHIEPSMDAHSWEQREERFRKKFEIGKIHIPMLFAGFPVFRPSADSLSGRRAPEPIRAIGSREANYDREPVGGNPEQPQGSASKSGCSAGTVLPITHPPVCRASLETGSTSFLSHLSHSPRRNYRRENRERTSPRRRRAMS